MRFLTAKDISGWVPGTPGVNILANKWMSHPGKIFCVGEKLLSALVVIMILLKISRLGKS